MKNREITIEMEPISVKVVLVKQLYNVAYYEATIIGIDGRQLARFGLGAEVRLERLYFPYKLDNEWVPPGFISELHKAIAESIGYEAVTH